MPVDEQGREPDDPHYTGPAGEHRDDKHGRPGAGKPKGDKKTGVLIILTAAGVLIAWLSLRGRSSSSTSTPSALSTANNPGNYPASSGAVAGYDQTAAAGFQAMLANLQSQIGMLVGGQQVGSGSATTAAPQLNDGWYDNVAYANNPSAAAQNLRYVSNGQVYNVDWATWLGEKKENPSASVQWVTGASPVYSTQPVGKV